MSSGPDKFVSRIWSGVTSSAIPLFVSLTLVGIGWLSISVFDFVKSQIEVNTFVIESIDRQTNAAQSYTALLRSQRSQNSTTTVLFPANNYCNENAQLPAGSVESMRSALLSNSSLSNGLYATVRFHRSKDVDFVTLRVSAGKLLYVGTVGDLPRNMCFNEAENAFTIEYTDSKMDVGENERILFVQTSEPGGQISVSGLKNRADAYLSATIIVVLVFLSFLTVLFGVVLSNTMQVRRNGKEDSKARMEFKADRDLSNQEIASLKEYVRKVALKEDSELTKKEIENLKEDVRKVAVTTHEFKDFLRRWAGRYDIDSSSSGVSYARGNVTSSGESIRDLNDEQARDLLNHTPDFANSSFENTNSNASKILGFRGSATSTKKLEK